MGAVGGLSAFYEDYRDIYVYLPALGVWVLWHTALALVIRYKIVPKELKKLEATHYRSFSVLLVLANAIFCFSASIV